MAERQSERPRAATLHPHLIPVPEPLSGQIDELVSALQARLGGEHVTEDIRAMVEVAVLKRGIESLKAEEGKR